MADGRSLLLVKRETPWLLKEADRLRSQKLLTSLGAGTSSITCACEFISGLAYGVAAYQGFCVLALTLKERASELIRN